MAEKIDWKNPEENKAYQRGYQAGLRSPAGARGSAARQRAHDRMWREVFCAALTGLIVRGSWQLDGKAATTGSEYNKIASHFANNAVAHFGDKA